MNGPVVVGSVVSPAAKPDVKAIERASLVVGGGLLRFAGKDLVCFVGYRPSEVRQLLRDGAGLRGNKLSDAVEKIVTVCRKAGNADVLSTMHAYDAQGGVFGRCKITRTGKIEVRGEPPAKASVATEADRLQAKLAALTGKRVTLS